MENNNDVEIIADTLVKIAIILKKIGIFLIFLFILILGRNYLNDIITSVVFIVGAILFAWVFKDLK